MRREREKCAILSQLLFNKRKKMLKNIPMLAYQRGRKFVEGMIIASSPRSVHFQFLIQKTMFHHPFHPFIPQGPLVNDVGFVLVLCQWIIGVHMELFVSKDALAVQLVAKSKRRHSLKFMYVSSKNCSRALCLSPQASHVQCHSPTNIYILQVSYCRLCQIGLGHKCSLCRKLRRIAWNWYIIIHIGFF